MENTMELDIDGALSCKQAVDFIEITLEVKDIQEKLQTQPGIDVINEIVYAFHVKIPYQTFTRMSIPFEKKKMPTLKDNVEYIVSGVGGGCWTKNSFMYLLLKTLGFEVYIGIASVYKRDTFGHLLTFVRNLVKTGDLYMVDVGIANPCFTAIPMDFEIETATYREAMDVYKFISNGEEIIRVSTEDCIIKMPIVEDGWGHFFFCDKAERNLTEVIQLIGEQTYYNTVSVLERNLVAYKYPNGRLIQLVNRRFRREDEAGQLVEVTMDTDQGICDVMAQYWPEIPHLVVMVAVRRWQFFKDSNAHRTPTDELSTSNAKT